MDSCSLAASEPERFSDFLAYALEARHRLVREYEPDVLSAMDLAPAGHRRRSDALLQQARGHGCAIDVVVGDAQQQGPAARGYAHRQSREFRDQHVASPLQLRHIGWQRLARG